MFERVVIVDRAMECATLIGCALYPDHAELVSKDADDIVNLVLKLITTERLSHASGHFLITYVFQVCVQKFGGKCFYPSCCLYMSRLYDDPYHLQRLQSLARLAHVLKERLAPLLPCILPIAFAAASKQSSSGLYAANGMLRVMAGLKTARYIFPFFVLC